MELVRFVLTLIDVTEDENTKPTLILCSLILLDVIIYSIYWRILRASLPEFVDPTDVEIDDLNYHTRMIQSRNERSFYVRNNRKFPFIYPFVCY